MNDSKSIRLHYLFRAAVLLAFACYIWRLADQDALAFYVAPALARWIKLCPVPLGLMALSLILQAVLGKSAMLCNCDHKLPASRLKSTALYGLFAFPLLLGFTLPDRALGTAAAAKKGMSFSYSAVEPEKAVRFETNDPYAKEFTDLAKILYAQPVIPVYPAIFSETFGAIDMYKKEFEGKQIAVSGFVYRDQAGAETEPFAVSRFLVQCCTADATPFGILVDPVRPQNLPVDTWVKVQGKLHVISHEGKEVIQIEASSISPIEQPDTPYIYTSADSVEAWHELQKGAKPSK
ncbi:TIGR03943 family protein [Paenibacillus sp. VCA1]|uniref:TIGR03943 family putative permease subunit n=1 Tax=Paenibacillus sp. VCA1 TaxID=3039148 RepID=UPI002872A51B|nr:TIGR03943 family protein [Paenibacillus sp. VCA1]MDR9854903.1 TIGR03943 family protein [Paenibacillus sp. VCA1]